MSLRKILLATDLSEESRPPFLQAVVLAKRTHRELVLFCACENRAAESTRDALEDLAAQARAAGASSTIWVAPGPASQAICATAADVDAHLVLVGTHGRTGFKRLLLGSVAEKVVRRCTRSVLVVRTPVAGAGFKNILAATDFSPASNEALDVAAGLAAAGGKIEITHFWQPPFSEGYAAEAVYESEAEIRGVLETQRQRILAQLQDRDVVASFHYYDEPCVQGVLARLDSLRYDLVAMGHGSHLGVHGAFIGSIAEAIVRHAPCSALVAQRG